MRRVECFAAIPRADLKAPGRWPRRTGIDASGDIQMPRNGSFFIVYD
jgi:hypothetical protein